MDILIFVNTRSRYNEGRMPVRVDLGMIPSYEIEEQLVKHLPDHDPEYFIQDYDSIGFDVEESTDFLKLNSILLAISKWDVPMFESICKIHGIDEAMKAFNSKFDNYYLYEGCNNLDTLGRYLVNDTWGTAEHNYNVVNYFDYKRYAQDFVEEAVGDFTNNGFLERIAECVNLK